MHPGDPRADPAVVDLIELAGLWVAASDWPALLRTLARLDDELQRRFPDDATFASRFRALRSQVERLESHLGEIRSLGDESLAETIRRTYRQATFG
jgi:hypothetical protein